MINPRCLYILLYLVLACLPLAARSPQPFADLGASLRRDHGASLVDDPALLCGAGWLRLGYRFTWKDGVDAPDQSLWIAYGGFAARIATGEAMDGSFRLLSLGHGFSFFGMKFGYGIDWFGAAAEPLAGLVSGRVGVASGSAGFFTALSVRDIPLSYNTGGLLQPEYRLSVGFRPLGDFFTISAAAALVHGEKLRDFDFDAGTELRLMDGFALGASLGRRDGESRLGVSLSVALSRLGSRTEGTLSSGKPALAVALEWQSAPGPGLLGPGPRFLSVDLSEPFPDTPVVQDGLLSSRRQAGFLDLLRALDRAAGDPSIRAVFLRVRAFPYGYGRAEELLTVLQRIANARKRLVVHLETGGSLAYAVLSVSRELSLHPEVSLRLHGSGGSVTFLKGLLDRLGLVAQFWYVGRYKTAAEQLLLDELTPAAREAEALVLRRRDDFLIDRIAWHRFEARREAAAALLLRGRIAAETARAEGLVDTLQDVDEARAVLGRQGLAAVELVDYLEEDARPPDWGERPLVAVVHVEGSIVRGRNSVSPLPFFGGKRAGDDTIIAALGAVGGDPRVKAVVIRVQSGGGDVVASERIWRAVNRLRGTGRPVLVSMGDVAASGGYYLACGETNARSRIFAPKNAITGSIGVFGGKLVVAGLQERLGIRTVLVTNTRFATADSMAFPYDDEEMRMLREEIEASYAGFIRRVAGGRGMALAAVDAVAQGRIWSGVDAREHGLIDGNLGFLEVVEEAARQAGLAPGRYRVAALPLDVRGMLSGLVPGLASAERLLADPEVLAPFSGGRVLAMLPYLLEYSADR